MRHEIFFRLSDEIKTQKNEQAGIKRKKFEEKVREKG